MITKELSPASPQVQNWHELHRAAIHETDRKKLPSRINEAEEAVARPQPRTVCNAGKEFRRTRRAWSRDVHTASVEFLSQIEKWPHGLKVEPDFEAHVSGEEYRPPYFRSEALGDLRSEGESARSFVTRDFK